MLREAQAKQVLDTRFRVFSVFSFLLFSSWIPEFHHFNGQQHRIYLATQTRFELASEGPIPSANLCWTHARGMNEHNIAIDHVKKFCDPHESLQILHMAICFIHVSSVFSMRLSCLWMSYANPPTIITGMGMNMTPATKVRGVGIPHRFTSKFILSTIMYV